MTRQPMTFRPPLEPEHHGPAIVHLQRCVEMLDQRQSETEAFIAMMKRWGERGAWAAAMVGLASANLNREQLADLAVKLFAVALGG